VFKQIKRLYHGITFNKVQFTNELYPFLRDQLKAVRKLVLYNTKISATTFREIIKSATGLEELYIFYSSMPSQGKKAIDRIPMPALKKLVATNWQQYRFLEHIGETSVRDLQLESNTISCEEFFQLQRSVEVLTITSDTHLSHIAAAPFKLQKISIAYPRWLYSSYIQRIVELLKAHTQTLKEIEFKGHFSPREVNEPVCTYILTRMRIETLVIESASNWPVNDRVQNIYLKKLVISNDHPPSATDAQRLFQAFPNIKDLEINENIDRELLVAMFSSLNLDRLVLSRISADEIADDRLKSLTLRGTALTNNVVQLNMPNLEELIIEDFFVNQQLNLTCRLPNLRRLSLLTPRFKISKRFTKEIKFGCPLLDALKVLKNPTVTEVNYKEIRFYQLDPTPQQAATRGDLLTMSFA
jgi:hypothetical protein